MKKLLILLLAAQMSFGDVKCENTLKACEEVIVAQDQAIDNLKKQVIVLKEEVESTKRATPAWVIFVGGLALGAFIHSIAKD